MRGLTLADPAFLASVTPSGPPGFNPLVLPVGTWRSVSWAEDPGWTNPGNGNGVASWRDGGTLGAPWAQSGPSAQPLYRASVAAFNNKPGIEFDGVNDTLSQGGAVTHTQPGTVVIVASATDAGATSKDLIDGTTNRWLLDETTGGVWRMFAGTSRASATAVDTNPHCHIAVFNGASSSWRIGGVALTLGGSVGTSSWSTPALMASGADRTPGVFAFIGILAGVIDATDRAFLEAGFATHYAL